jgi:succinate dehydrogenase / fumarate reductase, iron-sulfur subunit
MPETRHNTREVRIFRYDPSQPDEGHYDRFTLDIENEQATTILDVLLRLQREQDPTLAFRFACRVNMCGSCGMVINGKERLSCKTNVSAFAKSDEITLRPMNHFPVIRDLVVDMEPFFRKYGELLPFYEPKENYEEPALIAPDSRERRDIGMGTECIACGCCVSSCTMVHHHEGYAGPAALNRAFTLLADSRDALFQPRLQRALESCYDCRTEFNCTDVCPKGLKITGAIKHIQRLALTRIEKPAPQIVPPAVIEASQPMDRRLFLRQAGVALLGAGCALALGGIAGGTLVGPALTRTPKQWVPVTSLDHVKSNDVTTVVMNYDVRSGPYTQHVSAPVLVSSSGNQMVCFNATCPHLGCTVHWDGLSERFRCACHGGNFDREGNVLAGPPPRPLGRYAFKIDSGHLLVEVG